MKIYGIFRGFPGLGRVMSGIGIMNELKKNGHEVKVYSYLQGLDVLKKQEFEFIIEKQPTEQQIMAVGLSPIGNVAESLIKRICEEEPDLVIIDGEPLLVSTLSMVYPRKNIVALLNPADVYNTSQPLSSLKFFHFHYLSAGYAIVHGIDIDKIELPQEDYGCEIICVNTILRNSIIGLKKDEGGEIVAILGGGCSNSSANFWTSTVDIGNRIIEVAKIMKEERFVIYCNDTEISKNLNERVIPENVIIVDEYTMPDKIYKSAKIVLCRAGRNTVSELIYLDIPSVLMSSYGDFRSIEQERNISEACEKRPSRIVKSEKSDSASCLAGKIKDLMESKACGDDFTPGNEMALEYIYKILKNNNL